MVDWVKREIIPRHELLAWHMYEPGVSGHHVIADYSGNTRIISTAITNPPSLQSNLFNGQPGWYFDGGNDPLSWTGSITLKHAFILAVAEGPAFDQNRGLLSGVTSGDVLVSNSSGDTFFDLSFGSNYQYRKSGLAFAESNQKAPIGAAANAEVIEIVHSGGLALDGIQVGQQRDILGRYWKGWFFDELLYSGVKNAPQVFNIYRYYAMRYHAWQRASDGLYVFPFVSNKTSALETDKEHYLSEPYAGDLKALTRGGFKDGLQLPFLTREQEEFLAAKAFWKQHYPLGEFYYRDYRYYPYREVKCRFASPLREQGSDVTYRFNYSFEIVEVD